jgi:hypothetical protein
MANGNVVLLVFAFVLLVLAGCLAQTPEPSLWWRRLLAFGLACWVAAQIFPLLFR